MARIRTIKPEITQSETLAKVSREARLLFILLWTIVDDEGRARGASRFLASILFPYDDDVPGLIDGWIAELEAVGCVRRYEVDGNTYIDIPNWLKHQKIDHKGTSKIPAFREDSRTFAKPREASRECAKPREDSPLDLDLERDLDQKHTHTSRARASVDAPVWRKPQPRSSGLIDGSAQRLHGSHAWCSLPREGLCVPKFLHDEFVGKLGRKTADAELRDWYPSVLHRYDGQAIGDRPLDFWRNAFVEWVGTVTTARASPPKLGKVGSILAAGRRVIEKQLEFQQQQPEGLQLKAVGHGT